MYKKGFTLMEMLFVLIIAATIVAFAVPAYKRSKERAKYEAAVGILIEIGAASETLEKDMNYYSSPRRALQKYNDGSFFYHMPKSAAALEALPENKTITEFITENASKENDRFASVLFNAKYIEPFDGRTDYEFYLLPYWALSSANICGNKWRGVGVSAYTACMCLPDDKVTADNACFYGAVMGRDGKVVRFKHDICANN